MNATLFGELHGDGFAKSTGFYIHVKCWYHSNYRLVTMLLLMMIKRQKLFIIEDRLNFTTTASWKPLLRNTSYQSWRLKTDW